MIQASFNGWIEVDVLNTVKAWENPKNNLGLGIDVYDQDENSLNAKSHFSLQSCEAGKSVVWRFN